MTQLFLVKHSLPEIDPEIPACDWRLSDQGRARCVWLTTQMRARGVTRIYASPEPKAGETARIVADALGAELYVHKDLRENDRTDFGFHDTGDLRQRIQTFFDEPARLTIGRETAHDAISRFAAAIEQVTGESRGLTTAVIAHGTVITLFVARYNKVPQFALWDHLGAPSFVSLDAMSYKFDGKIHNFAS